MQAHTMRWRALAAVAASFAASGVLAAQAGAHAEVSPSITQKGHSEVYTLAVPTEQEGATTASVELTVPSGFAIDSFEAEPGWKRTVRSTGSGEEAVVNRVTWAGGRTPTGEDSMFRFLASTTKSGDYTFKVRQTYSDGKVVDWSGAESSDTPSPVVTSVDSLGAGGSSSSTAAIALILSIAALVLGFVGLVARRGGRELT